MMSFTSRLQPAVLLPCLPRELCNVALPEQAALLFPMMQLTQQCLLTDVKFT